MSTPENITNNLSGLPTRLFDFWFNRPGSKEEENMFTRLVQLDRLTDKSRKDEMLELFRPGHSTDPERHRQYTHSTHDIIRLDN